MSEGSIEAVLSGDATYCILHGDCLERLKLLPDNSVDACVCDPPYHLTSASRGGSPRKNDPAKPHGRHAIGSKGFMGKTWDGGDVAMQPETWAEVLRVLKPGGHLIAFGGTRTAHRMTCAIEDAGFEIRDVFSWMFGSGFPKSLSVAKAIDKARKDEAEIRVVCRWLRARITEHPTETNVSLARLFGFHVRMVEHWAATDGDSQPTLPTLEQWDRLRDVLGFGDEMDAEVLRLNLRKGLPGDAWFDRPVTGTVKASEGKVAYSIKGRDGIARDKAVAEESIEWEGWGTALKPAHEPIILARKPLETGLTVAENVRKWGTGALNIDGCRVAHGGAADLAAHQAQVAAIKARGGSMEGSWKNSSDLSGASEVNLSGRWPPNVLFCHSLECKRIGAVEVPANPTWDTPNRKPPTIFGSEVPKVSGTRHANGRGGEASAAKRYDEQGSTSFAPLPGARRDDTETVEQWECVEGCPVRELSLHSGQLTSGTGAVKRASAAGFTGSTFGVESRPEGTPMLTYGDSGSAARFFPQFQHDPELDTVIPFLYAAKANRAERDAGLEHFRSRTAAEVTDSEEGQARLESPRTGAGRTGGVKNPHPTIKPIELLRWLIRLVTPPKGIVLDPFAGAGSCGCAARIEGMRYVACELNNTDEEPYVEIMRARLNHIEGRSFVPRESLRVVSTPVQRSLFEIT